MNNSNSPQFKNLIENWKKQQEDIKKALEPFRQAVLTLEKVLGLYQRQMQDLGKNLESFLSPMSDFSEQVRRCAEQNPRIFPSTSESGTGLARKRTRGC